MHAPDQQPAQPEDEKMEPVADETQEQQGLQALYEFPPSGSLVHEALQAAPVTRVLPEVAAEPRSLNEPAPQAQGFVYPPPPSFYQDMVVPPQNPPLPPARAGQPSVVYAAAPPTQRPMHPQGYMYAPPGVPPFVSQPPVKKSYKWIWIVVTLLSVLILASCGLCSWGFYTVFSSTFQQVAGSLDVVNDFYTNLQGQNYSAAYSDLAPQGQISNLTQNRFIKQAQARDELYGLVKSFVPGQPGFAMNPNTGPDLSHFTIIVNVNRTHLSYTVLLNVHKLRANWKITEYDQL